MSRQTQPQGAVDVVVDAARRGLLADEHLEALFAALRAVPSYLLEGTRHDDCVPPSSDRLVGTALARAERAEAERDRLSAMLDCCDEAREFVIDERDKWYEDAKRTSRNSNYWKGRYEVLRKVASNFVEAWRRGTAQHVVEAVDAIENALDGGERDE